MTFGSEALFEAIVRWLIIRDEVLRGLNCFEAGPDGRDRSRGVGLKEGKVDVGGRCKPKGTVEVGVDTGLGVGAAGWVLEG